MKKILVSACLCGEPCRYDGRSKPCTVPVFLKWREEGRLIPVCPEVDGGLPVPRPPCQRRGDGVFTEAGESRTAEYLLGADKALETARKEDVACCILKEYSPSCGVHRIYDGTFSGKKISGEGLAAQLLRENGYAVFSEEELSSAEEFLKTE